MTTEVWFRNPHSYIRELVECGQSNVAWDRGTLTKKRIDPFKHAQLYYGESYPWRLLVVGDQGTAELDSMHDMSAPKAVYPTFEYGDELNVFEDLLANPAGESEEVCSTPGIPPDELPIFGQEHRVVVTGMPPAGTGPGRAFLRTLKELQEDYPESIIHLHGPYSWRVAFGTGIRSADVEPRTDAQKGKVTLPNGTNVPYEKTFSKAQWARAIGFEPGELRVPRNRCMFNIKSAAWAGEHYQELFRFRSIKLRGILIDTDTPSAEYKPLTTSSYRSVQSKAKEGDKFTCNTCSLMDECKYFREGAVCSVPNSEPIELSRYFGTRDSGQILDGLAILMKSGIKRYERLMEDESVTGEVIPEVTKMQSHLFEQGVKLAKLHDPSLRGTSGVQVNVGGHSAVQVNNGNPRQAIAAAFRELEARGIARDAITPQMIEGVLSGMNDPAQAHRAIEATVIDQEEKTA
jgi:hypothetical protein